MGKWLERLHETTVENNHIPVKTALTKPTKESVQILLSPFVSAESRDSQFFSNPKLLDENPNDLLEKTVKTSKQELTIPTKGIAGDEDDNPKNQQIAEHKINGLKLHGDRVFVRQKLVGIYGKKRLDIVNKYLEQWRLGVVAEPVAIKQENAGRYRANVWIREKKFN